MLLLNGHSIDSQSLKNWEEREEGKKTWNERKGRIERKRRRREMERKREII